MPEILDVATSGRELAIRRRLAAPRAAVWRCWTEPALLEPWFCPKPWRVTDVVLDPRTGGSAKMNMCGPNGEENPIKSVYLEFLTALSGG